MSGSFRESRSGYSKHILFCCIGFCQIGVISGCIDLYDETVLCRSFVSFHRLVVSSFTDDRFVSCYGLVVGRCSVVSRITGLYRTVVWLIIPLEDACMGFSICCWILQLTCSGTAGPCL